MANQWTCGQSTCPPKFTCQRTLDDSHKCMPSHENICTAWGGPHIKTFDGAMTDVFGVGSYVLVKSTFNDSPGWFNVKMITESTDGAPGWPVGMTNTIEVEFPLGDAEFGAGLEVKVITDRHGKFEVWEREELGEYELLDENLHEKFVQMANTPDQVSFSTWFGLEIEHEGSSARVRLPQWYSKQIEGLCGDFDQQKENDWFLRNGTVLPFDDNSFTGSESEYLIANDWKHPGESEEPPIKDPGEIQVCAEGVNFADVEQQCEELFDEAILKSCIDYFDPSDYINACKVDLCANPGPETKSEILKTYIHDCTDRRDDNELKCSWFNNITGKFYSYICLI